MADTLKSLVDASVQTELDSLVAALKNIRSLMTEISSSQVSFRGGSYSDQKKAVEDLRTVNEQLNISQQKVVDSAIRLSEAQKLQAQTSLTSSTRMAAMTENSKLLQKALADVKQQLQDGIAAGRLSAEQQAKLGEQTAILTTLVNQQQKGFSSLTAEVRAGERALQTMREAGLQNTVAFKQLQLSTADTRREFNNFAKEQKILSSEAPAIQALTIAARGLGGAYAVGAGSAALFGDESGKIEKELRPLIAVMTILKGLEEANAAIQQKNAVTTSVSVMWGELLTKLYIRKAVAVEADTIATIANTAAIEGEAVAAETATIATGTLEAVLSGGLMVVIGAVIYGITKLIGAVTNWIDADDKAIEKQAQLAEATAKVLKTIKEQDDATVEAAKRKIEVLDNQFKKDQAYGMSQIEVLAREKQIAEQKKKIYLQLAQDHGLSINQMRANIQDFATVYSNDLKILEGQQKRYRENRDKDMKDDSSEQKTLKSAIEANEKLIANNKAAYEILTNIVQGYENAKQTIEENASKTSKLNDDEIREYRLASTKYAAEHIIQMNEQILSSEASTQKQRLTAEKNILAQKIVLINAEKAAKLSSPEISGDPEKVKRAELDGGAAIEKARIESKERLQKINLDYAKRDLATYWTIRNTVLDTQKALNEEILQNEGSTLAQKLKAKTQEISIEAQLEVNRFNEQKSKLGITQAEIEALEAEHQVKLNAIVDKGQKDLLKLKDDAIAKQLEQAQKLHDGMITAQKDANSLDETARVKKQSEAYSDLSSQYLRSAISAREYAKTKKDLDNKFALQNITDQIDQEEKLSKKYDHGSKERFESEAKVAKLKKQLGDERIKQNADEIEKQKKKVDDYVKYEQKGAELVSSIVDGQFERRKNEIQHEIDLIDIRKEADINAINSSTLNAQQKAAELFNAERVAAAHKEKLQRDQRNEDIKKAKFDKAAALLQIGVSIATEEVKALDYLTNPLTAAAYPGIAATIAALGAVQLAVVAAKPIPQYAAGTDFAPGGPAIVGEKGRELRITPTGEVSFTPDVATKVNLNRGDKIIPNHEMPNILAQIAHSLNVPDVKKVDTGTDMHQVVSGLKAVQNEIRKQKPAIVSFKSTGEWQAYIEKETN